MKKVFILFLSCLLLLLFSFFCSADSIPVFDSVMSEPSWDFLPEDNGLNSGSTSFNTLLTSSDDAFLLVTEFTYTNWNSSNSHPSFYFSTSSSKLYLYFLGSNTVKFSLYDVSDGSLIYSDESFSSSKNPLSGRTTFNLTFLDSYFSSIYTYYSCATLAANSFNLIFINNVNWSVPRPPFSAGFVSGLLSDSHFLSFSPSSSWADYGQYFLYSPSNDSSDSWYPSFDLTSQFGRDFGLWSTDRYNPDLFTFSSCSAMFSIIDDDRSFVYGESFKLSSLLYSYPCLNTFCFVCSDYFNQLILDILNADYASDFDPFDLLYLLISIDSDDVPSGQFVYSSFYPVGYFTPIDYSNPREILVDLSVNFSIPADFSDDRIYFYCIQVSDQNFHLPSGYQTWGLSDIFIDPVGSSKSVVSEYKNRVLFQQSVISGFDSIHNDLDLIYNFLIGDGSAPVYPNVVIPDFAEESSLGDALLIDYSDDLSSVFSDSDNIFSSNGAFALISNTFNQIIFGNLKLNSLILFCLCFGIAILIIGRKLNNA